MQGPTLWHFRCHHACACRTLWLKLQTKTSPSASLNILAASGLRQRILWAASISETRIFLSSTWNWRGMQRNNRNAILVNIRCTLGFCWWNVAYVNSSSSLWSWFFLFIFLGDILSCSLNFIHLRPSKIIFLWKLYIYMLLCLSTAKVEILFWSHKVTYCDFNPTTLNKKKNHGYLCCLQRSYSWDSFSQQQQFI